MTCLDKKQNEKILFNIQTRDPPTRARENTAIWRNCLARKSLVVRQGEGESGFGSNVRFLLLVQVVKERQQQRRNGKEGVLKALGGREEGTWRYPYMG